MLIGSVLLPLPSGVPSCSVMLAVTLLAKIGNAFGFRASNTTASSTLSGVMALTCTERGFSSGGFGFEQPTPAKPKTANSTQARRLIRQAYARSERPSENQSVSELQIVGLGGVMPGPPVRRLVTSAPQRPAANQECPDDPKEPERVRLQEVVPVPGRREKHLPVRPRLRMRPCLRMRRGMRLRPAQPSVNGQGGSPGEGGSPCCKAKVSVIFKWRRASCLRMERLARRGLSTSRVAR